MSRIAQLFQFHLVQVLARFSGSLVGGEVSMIVGSYRRDGEWFHEKFVEWFSLSNIRNGDPEAGE